MKYTIDILDEIAGVSSRNEKVKILEREKNNVELRECVKAALCPMTQYYIRKIPEYTPSNRPFSSLIQVIRNLKTLSDRLITGQKAIDYLQAQFELLEDKDALVLERIIQKDLKCGVSIKTVNKVWPGLIHEYPVMLCERMSDKNLQKITWPAICQVKYDGMRSNIVLDFDHQVIKIYSRNGKFIDIGDVFKPLLELYRSGKVVLDGEFLVEDRNGSILSRKEGNGIINKAIKGTITEEESSMIRFVVWDQIPYNHFVNGLYDVPYNKRFGFLKMMVSRCHEMGILLMKLAETRDIDSFYEAHKWYLDVVERGDEGIIIKDAQGPWEAKRSPFSIKMKVENEADLLVVGIQEGTGKYQGKLGSFLLEDSSGALSVSVGSGFSDEQRDIYFSDSMIGKIVTVKYNEVISNQKGEKSLFLPIFVEVRHDKSEADSIENLS